MSDPLVLTDAAVAPSGPVPPSHGAAWPFLALVVLGLGMLVGSLIAAVAAPPPWSWALALVLLPYESLLTLHLLGRSRRAADRQRSAPAASAATPAPGLAMLIAARNERAVLPATLAAIRAQTLPGDEVLVIDDGSTDGTAAWLAEEFGLTEAGGVQRGVRWPGLILVRRERNGGKAAALNAGLAATTLPVVVCLDADTSVQPGALAALRQAFVAEPDLTTACGVVIPTCPSGRWAWYFQTFQRLEYRRSYTWRLGWMEDRTLVLVPGAFAAFRREALVAVGGFDPASRVEDYEVMFRLHRQAIDQGRTLLVRVVAGAQAITDAPVSLPQFLRQRRRWFAGFIATMVRHHRLVGNPRAGRLGTVHLVFKTIDMVLPLFGITGLLLLALVVLGGWSIPPLILGLMAGKWLLDAVLHGLADRRFWRWLGDGQAGHPITPLLLLADPLVFQPVRQCGAVAGVIAYLRGAIDWAPQRPLHPGESRIVTPTGS